MGILDDVTHAGEEPTITISQDTDKESAHLITTTGEKSAVFMTIPQEDITALKDWLASALDDEKFIHVNENVTKTVYYNSRFLVKPIFQGIRTKLAEMFETENGSFPTVSQYYTISYSNSEPFTYTNDVTWNSAPEDGSGDQYKMYIVFEGSLKTSNFTDKVFSVNESYCMFTGPYAEDLLNSGEEDSLILCVTFS